MMEPDELERQLKLRLEQWSDDFSKVHDSNMKYDPLRKRGYGPLGDIQEANVVYCIADVLRIDGWNCFFEIEYKKREYNKTKKKKKRDRRCDILARKPEKKNSIWVECKLLYDEDKRLTKKRWKNEFMKDFNRLKRLKRARGYLVIFVKYESDKLEMRQTFQERLGGLDIDFKTDGHNVDENKKKKIAFKIFVKEV